MRWWNRWSVPALPVMVALLIVGVAIGLAFKQQSVDRREAAYNAVYSSTFAACNSSNEFRDFMASYLTSQISPPPDQTPGYDQLSPETKALIASLAPVLDAGREQRQQFAATYVAKFPIQDCAVVAAARATAAS